MAMGNSNKNDNMISLVVVTLVAAFSAAMLVEIIMIPLRISPLFSPWPWPEHLLPRRRHRFCPTRTLPCVPLWGAVAKTRKIVIMALLLIQEAMGGMMMAAE